MSTQKSDTYVVTQVPANVADSGKVRLGGAYPSLTPVRAAITEGSPICNVDATET